MTSTREPEAPHPGDVAADVVAALSQALPPGCVLTGTAIDTRHTADWSAAAAARPRALLLPKSPQQVATALQLCSRFRAPVAVQGGLTGLVGGANPQPGEIALSLASLHAIEDFDEVGGTVLVQAGVTLEQLQSEAAGRGWSFPLDLGARGSCQLGGNAATNAGGSRVLRYGMMRQLVLGLEVACADGQLLTMLNRVVKDNAGPDLKQLFIGSEGTLGVITRLSLKLEPARLASATLLCAVDGFAKATALLRSARSALPDLSAFELMWSDFFEASCAAGDRKSPFVHKHPLYVLMEVQGREVPELLASVERVIGQALEEQLVDDAVVAQSIDQAQGLWAIREGVSELLALQRPCAAFDVSVAMPDMDLFVHELRGELEQRFPAARHLFFGHLADGNLHLVSGPHGEHDQLERVERIVYARVRDFKGSVSAEHGIGFVKKGFLSCTRSPAEIELMARLKQLMDPQQILNRGRILDAPA